LIARPAFAPVYAGVLTVVVLLGVTLGPWPDWWALYLPRPAAAAFRLREKNYLIRYDDCANEAVADWQAIRASPDAVRWFTTITEEATTNAGRLYGLVGLQDTDSVRFAVHVSILTARQLADTVFVVDSDGVRLLSVRSALAGVERSVLSRAFKDPTPRPDC
jgi:hypothetical protein